MTAYQDIKMLNHFINMMPDDWGIYVHLDVKSKIHESEIISKAKLYRIKRIFWGAWEHLYVIYYMLQEAVKENKYDYFHIVSAQDYFAVSPAKFDQILGEGNNYIGYHQLPGADFWWEGGYKIFRYKTLSSFGDIRKPLCRFLNKGLYLFQKFFRCVRPLPKLDLYGGSVYCSLHKEFVSWLTTNMNMVTLLMSLKNTTCSEEVFFQTAIMNSPYKDTCINKTLRYVDWHANPAPKFLTEVDLNKILESECLFCRKLNSLISLRLIELIDKSI